MKKILNWFGLYTKKDMVAFGNYIYANKSKYNNQIKKEDLTYFLNRKK